MKTLYLFTLSVFTLPCFGQIFGFTDSISKTVEIPLETLNLNDFCDNNYSDIYYKLYKSQVKDFVNQQEKANLLTKDDPCYEYYVKYIPIIGLSTYLEQSCEKTYISISTIDGYFSEPCIKYQILLQRKKKSFFTSTMYSGTVFGCY